jgi:hypothetical protein
MLTRWNAAARDDERPFRLRERVDQLATRLLADRAG